MHIKQALRVWMLPIAMVGGILFHNHMGKLSPLSPWLIAAMLFFTYCRLDIKDLHLPHFALPALLIQIVGAWAAYFLLCPFSPILAQAAFICFFCPTATAAPVITGMLGGSIASVASYSLICNLAVALLAPLCFTLINQGPIGAETSFLHVVTRISIKVVPLILGPLIAALLLKRISPPIHRQISQHQDVSFYLWAVSLFIIVGNAVSYVVRHLAAYPDEGSIMIATALVSLTVCVVQFGLGRRLGARYNEKISAAQSLGQKNTVLAVWMALTFLNPLSSIGPAAYVAWQNTINSAQLAIKSRRDRHKQTT